MSPEARQTQTPEQPQYTAEQIGASFEAAQQRLHGLMYDESFLRRCMSLGINPQTEKGTAAYWDQVAAYANEQLTEERNAEGNELDLNTYELVAITPSYLFAQSALDRKSFPNRSARRTAKEKASYYNSALRIFATTYPEAEVSTVTSAVLSTVNESMSNEAIRQNAARQLHYTIRGAQHELAFGQIVAHTGRKCSPASLEEDLRGIDYVVEGFAGKELYVDVKASLSEIENHGEPNSAFACKRDGKIIMFSLSKDSEFGGKFHLPEAVAAQKADAMNQLLVEAQVAQMAA